jgi:transposase
MTRIREILRLRESHLSQRAIARALRVSHPVVGQYLRDAEAAGLRFADVEHLGDSELLERLAATKAADERYVTAQPWFEYCFGELKRCGVTIQLIWNEYREKHTDGFSYSQFCYHFQVWREADAVTMHIEHKAGDKLFVDFTGERFTITDPRTGEQQPVESFVAVLGASQLCFMQATETQQKEDWIAANEAALHYLCGVPAAIVPDALKSAVNKNDPYDPDLNPAYADFARHYGTVILPARSRKPKDKALVENAVRLMYLRVYAPLRNRVFHSLDELNAAIRRQVDEHNDLRFQRLPLSRRELFEQVERQALRPLPATRYEHKTFLSLKVPFNYHIELREDRHYYSVPWRLKGKRVQVLYTVRMVEIYHDHLRVAAHRRERTPGAYTTDAAHMPPQHRFYHEWSPQRMLDWATATGPAVRELVAEIFARREHHEQASKVCLGILSLQKKYGAERLDRACRRASEYGHYSYRGVKEILANGLDRIVQEELFGDPLPAHANIRGIAYYADLGGT